MGNDHHPHKLKVVGKGDPADLWVPLIQGLEVDKELATGRLHDGIKLAPCHQTYITAQTPLQVPGNRKTNKQTKNKLKTNKQTN